MWAGAKEQWQSLVSRPLDIDELLDKAERTVLKIMSQNTDMLARSEVGAFIIRNQVQIILECVPIIFRLHFPQHQQSQKQLRPIQALQLFETLTERYAFSWNGDLVNLYVRLAVENYLADTNCQHPLKHGYFDKLMSILHKEPALQTLAVFAIEKTLSQNENLQKLFADIDKLSIATFVQSMMFVDAKFEGNYSWQFKSKVLELSFGLVRQYLSTTSPELQLTVQNTLQMFIFYICHYDQFKERESLYRQFDMVFNLIVSLTALPCSEIASKALVLLQCIECRALVSPNIASLCHKVSQIQKLINLFKQSSTITIRTLDVLRCFNNSLGNRSNRKQAIETIIRLGMLEEIFNKMIRNRQNNLLSSAVLETVIVVFNITLLDSYIIINSSEAQLALTVQKQLEIDFIMYAYSCVEIIKDVVARLNKKSLQQNNGPLQFYNDRLADMCYKICKIISTYSQSFVKMNQFAPGASTALKITLAKAHQWRDYFVNTFETQEKVYGQPLGDFDQIGLLTETTFTIKHANNTTNTATLEPKIFSNTQNKTDLPSQPTSDTDSINLQTLLRQNSLAQQNNALNVLPPNGIMLMNEQKEQQRDIQPVRVTSATEIPAEGKQNTIIVQQNTNNQENQESSYQSFLKKRMGDIRKVPIERRQKCRSAVKCNSDSKKISRWEHSDQKQHMNSHLEKEKLPRPSCSLKFKRMCKKNYPKTSQQRLLNIHQDQKLIQLLEYYREQGKRQKEMSLRLASEIAVLGL